MGRIHTYQSGMDSASSSICCRLNSPPARSAIRKIKQSIPSLPCFCSLLESSRLNISSGLSLCAFFSFGSSSLKKQLDLGHAFLQTMKHWWPYFLIWIVDALWLAYYYKSGAYVSYGVTATRHALSIKALLLAFGDAFWKAGFYVWVQVLVLAGQSITAPTTILTFVLIVLSFLSIAFYILHLDLSTPLHLPPFSLKMGERRGGLRHLRHHHWLHWHFAWTRSILRRRVTTYFAVLL